MDRICRTGEAHMQGDPVGLGAEIAVELADRRG